MKQVRVFVPIVPKIVPNPFASDQGTAEGSKEGVAEWWFHLPANYPSAGSLSDSAAAPAAGPGSESANSVENDKRHHAYTRPFVRQVSAATDGRCLVEARNALAVAEAFHLEPSRLWTPSQLRRGEGEWLDAVKVGPGPTDLREWDGPSTTLGLALGLVMVGSGCDTPQIVATGDLKTMQSWDQTEVVKDIEVRCIEGLQRKFELVENWARKRMAEVPQLDRRILFFLPLQSWDEKPSRPLDREEFERRIRAGDNSWHARMEAVGVELVGVKTFPEAARRLKARRLKPNAADWWTNVARGALVVAGAAAIVWGTVAWRGQLWRERPIDGGLAFAPVIDTAGQPHATPFRTSGNRPDTARPLCENGGLVAGQWMNVRLRTGDGSTPAETFWPVVVALPRTAGHRLNVYAAEDPKHGCDAGPVASGAVWACNFETDPTEFSDLLLMAFADRERNIATDIEQEVDKVKTRFATTGADGTPEVNLRSVINHFTALYPGRLITTMTRTVKPSKDCPL